MESPRTAGINFAAYTTSLGKRAVAELNPEKTAVISSIHPSYIESHLRDRPMLSIS